MSSIAPDDAVLDFRRNLVSTPLIHAGIQVDTDARLLSNSTLFHVDVEGARRRAGQIEELDAIRSIVQNAAAAGTHRVVKLVPLLALKELQT